MLRSTQFNDALLRFFFGRYLYAMSMRTCFIKSTKNHRSCNSTFWQNPFFKKVHGGLEVGGIRRWNFIVFLLTYAISNLIEVVNYEYQCKIFFTYKSYKNIIDFLFIIIKVKPANYRLCWCISHFHYNFVTLNSHVKLTCRRSCSPYLSSIIVFWKKLRCNGNNLQSTSHDRILIFKHVHAKISFSENIQHCIIYKTNLEDIFNSCSRFYNSTNSDSITIVYCILHYLCDYFHFLLNFELRYYILHSSAAEYS